MDAVVELERWQLDQVLVLLYGVEQYVWGKKHFSSTTLLAELLFLTLASLTSRQLTSNHQLGIPHLGQVNRLQVARVTSCSAA